MTERIEESHMRIPRSWRYFKLLSQSMRYFWIGLNFLLDEKCFVPSRAMNWIHVLSYFYYSNLNRMTQPNVREMKQAASHQENFSSKCNVNSVSERFTFMVLFSPCRKANSCRFLSYISIIYVQRTKCKLERCSDEIH